MKFIFTPSPIFKDSAKRKFLAAFDMRYPASEGAPWLVLTARLLGAAFAIAAIVMSGATLYADAANVPADSPLYPFKRLGENVQLAVTPPQGDASLQATFAARRVAEITDLENRNPRSTMITKLSSDADNAVDASIVAAGDSNLGGGALTHLCVRLLSALVPSSTVTSTQEDLHGNLNLLDRFTSRCESASGTPQEAPRAVERPLLPEHSTSSPPATSTLPGGEGSEAATFRVASSSGEAPPNVPELETRIRNYLDTHVSASSSLDLLNPRGDAGQGAVIGSQDGFRGRGGDGSGGNGGGGQSD